MKKNLNIDNKGFTLIEAVFILVIAVMVIYVSSTFIVRGFRSSAFAEEQNIAIRNARKINQLMVNEIREGIRSEAGDYILDTTDPQELTFYGDIDKDSNVEKIRYFLDNSILKRGVTKPSGAPIEYVALDEVITEVAYYINNQSEPIFTYHDRNNIIIADPPSNKTRVRLISISLKINVTPTIAPNDYYVEMDAQLRNLKDNL
jgi:type II secretory pathway pseudopilin PulG